MSAREPLSAEERELQRRLEEWTVSGPPEALDARVLAQARAAAAASAAGAASGVRPPRRHRPLTVGLASAAALVLTVGLVWRVAEQPGPAERPPASAAPQMRASEPASPRVESASDQPLAPRAQRDHAASAEAHRPAAPAPADAGSDQAGRSEPIAAEVQAPARHEQAPTADPGAAALRSPPATQARADAVETTEAEGRDDVDTFAAPPPPPPPPSPPAPGPDAFARELAQVRDLIARGEQAAARSTLLEVRRRHPERELPDDLQAWLDQPPTR